MDVIENSCDALKAILQQENLVSHQNGGYMLMSLNADGQCMDTFGPFPTLEQLMTALEQKGDGKSHGNTNFG